MVYCSVDETFARQVLGEFERQSGTKLSIIGDTEAGKTTGLVKRIMNEAQAGNPHADVFWSSELFNTILLAKRGLLEPYASPAAADIPDKYRDSQNRWTASAVRARVVAFDPTKVSAAELPTRWEELAEPRFAKHVAIANPLFGTTRGHVAAMFVMWGEGRAISFLQRLRSGGARIEAGNSSAVRAVMSGKAKFAATDTDDVWMAQKSGASIDLRYLDMGDGGTLLVPCSVAILKGCANSKGARQLVDYLVSADVEKLLANSRSRNIPVRESVRKELDIDWPAESNVEYEAIAESMDESSTIVRDIFLR